MTYEEALDYAIKRLRNDGNYPVIPSDLEAADILDTCHCKFDFTDGTAYCQECGRKSALS